MAKTQAPNSGGSQFFIVTNPNGTPHLDGIHTVFGKVTTPREGSRGQACVSPTQGTANRK